MKVRDFLLIYNLYMNHLKKFESFIFPLSHEIGDIKKDITDICQELKDEYFRVAVAHHIDNSNTVSFSIRIELEKSPHVFPYSVIHETIERLKVYMRQQDFQIQHMNAHKIIRTYNSSSTFTVIDLPVGCAPEKSDMLKYFSIGFI